MSPFLAVFHPSSSMSARWSICWQNSAKCSTSVSTTQVGWQIICKSFSKQRRTDPFDAVIHISWVFILLTELHTYLLR